MCPPPLWRCGKGQCGPEETGQWADDGTVLELQSWDETPRFALEGGRNAVSTGKKKQTKQNKH